MEHHLSLIKTEFQDLEKRTFPRFPFTFLMFKDEQGQIYEVADVSYTGMQLILKDGKHNYSENAVVKGVIQWKGEFLDVDGAIKWSADDRFGIEFSNKEEFQKNVQGFFSMKNFSRHMREINAQELNIELPQNLKYWIRTEGPMEIFVWNHQDGEKSKFQFIMMEHFVEWEDGRGLRTGRVLTKRDVDTPLISTDEFVFQLDNGVNAEKIYLAKELVGHLSSGQIEKDLKEFLELKLTLD